MCRICEMFCWEYEETSGTGTERVPLRMHQPERLHKLQVTLVSSDSPDATLQQYIVK